MTIFFDFFAHFCCILLRPRDTHTTHLSFPIIFLSFSFPLSGDWCEWRETERSYHEIREREYRTVEKIHVRKTHHCTSRENHKWKVLRKQKSTRFSAISSSQVKPNQVKNRNKISTARCTAAIFLTRYKRWELDCWWGRNGCLAF